MSKFDTTICFDCGNPATPDSRLVWSDDGRYKTHEWDEEREESLCPPPREGWVRCASCFHLLPPSDLFLAEDWQPIEWVDGEPQFPRDATKRSDYGLHPPSKNARPFWERWSRADAPRDEDGNIEVDEGTRGIVWYAGNDGQLLAACDECAKYWDDSERKRYPRGKSAAREAGPDEPDLAAMVPVDRAVEVTQLMALWKLGDRATRDAARELVREGKLAVETAATKTGGQPKKLYRRAAE